MVSELRSSLDLRVVSLFPGGWYSPKAFAVGGSGLVPEGWH